MKRKSNPAKRKSKPAEFEEREEIRQIVPCIGDWKAVYRDRKSGEEHSYPVACWALVVIHVDPSAWGTEQFEWARGLVPHQEDQNLIGIYEELSDEEEFLGYQKD